MSTRLYTTVGGRSYALDILMEEAKLNDAVLEAKRAKTTIPLPLQDRAERPGTLFYDGGNEEGNTVVGNVDLGPDGLPMPGSPPIGTGGTKAGGKKAAKANR